MNEKVEVTLVFYELDNKNKKPDEKDKFVLKEFHARLNASASLGVLLPALLDTYKTEVTMGDADQLDIFMELPRSWNLSQVRVSDGSRIVIMPKNLIPSSLVEPLDKK